MKKSDLEISYKKCSECFAFEIHEPIILRSRVRSFAIRVERPYAKNIPCRNVVSVFPSQSVASLHSVDRVVLQFVRKFCRRSRELCQDGLLARVRVREKLRMTESVACKFLFAGRYIFRDAMLANVSVGERPNNSYSTCVRIRIDDPSFDHLISRDLTI